MCFKLGRCVCQGSPLFPSQLAIAIETCANAVTSSPLVDRVTLQKAVCKITLFTDDRCHKGYRKTPSRALIRYWVDKQIQ